MFFLKKFIISRRDHKNQINAECNALILRIHGATTEVDPLFKGTYIDVGEVDQWKNKNAKLLRETMRLNIKSYKRAKSYCELISQISELQNFSETFKHKILAHNQKVLECKISKAYDLIGDIEGRRLDSQQMASIVEESNNQLVIAGAGTGKTTTIIGKIKYLVNSKQYQARDILALSFTNASAAEMSERIEMELGMPISASTFHKLGLDIICHVEGKKPKISKVNLRSFIKGQITTLMNQEKYLRLLTKYMLYSHIMSKTEFDFKTQDEYDEYLNVNPPTTIKGEKVKSYGEVDIANFLFEHDIEYIYESPYKVDTRDSEHGQYYPDFYLPDHDIYIEYFGINHQNQVPEYFHSSHGLSPSDEYLASMDWKRDLHKKHGTTMVECYAYERFEDKLLLNLEQKLRRTSVVIKQLDAKTLWGRVNQNKNAQLDGVITLFETVINLAKSKNCNIDDIQQNVNNAVNQMLLDLIHPIFKSYQSQLVENGEIDFNDMINLATTYVQQGKYINPYKFVIVDEYQDISQARFDLLKSLRNSKDYKLFCVGDDWQSIYRFAGSDIDFILNFGKYWGSAVISKIETTYRFPNFLAEVSGDFIMQNPDQITKQICGQKESNLSSLGFIQGYNDFYSIKFMLDKLNELPKDSSVFLIGRYSFDIKLLDEFDSVRYSYNNEEGMIRVRYLNRMDLDINFLTAHKSKGLQADFVFVINNKKGRMGFPSKIQDAPILDLLLNNREHFPDAEERRLFYVVLTRAKEKVFIVAVKGYESDFILELEDKFADEIKREKYECPLCGGRLVRRNSQYGEFYGCSNYSTFGCKFTKNIKTKPKVIDIP